MKYEDSDRVRSVRTMKVYIVIPHGDRVKLLDERFAEKGWDHLAFSYPVNLFRRRKAEGWYVDC
jgi:hypothetical protein